MELRRNRKPKRAPKATLKPNPDPDASTKLDLTLTLIIMADPMENDLERVLSELSDQKAWP